LQVCKLRDHAFTSEHMNSTRRGSSSWSLLQF
jgi:hypothetical protein